MATINKFILVSLILLLLPACFSGRGTVILATTTSTDNSGLLDVLTPMFEASTGYKMKVISVGSGAALRMGERRDVDVLLVHSPVSELVYMGNGHGSYRQPVMHNDFVLVGPPDDPAGLATSFSLESAMEGIAQARALFFSRGDESGTHAKELSLWPTGHPPSYADWYHETGQGMGNTLTIASQKGGYTLADRGTFLTLSDSLNLEILLQGDPLLENIYHVIQVRPTEGSRLNVVGAAAFAEFLVEEETQCVIASFGVESYGEPLFFPDAFHDC